MHLMWLLKIICFWLIDDEALVESSKRDYISSQNSAAHLYRSPIGIVSSVCYISMALFWIMSCIFYYRQWAKQHSTSIAIVHVAWCVSLSGWYASLYTINFLKQNSPNLCWVVSYKEGNSWPGWPGSVIQC